MIGIDAFLHYVAGSTLGTLFSLTGLSLQDNAILTGVICVGKELMDIQTTGFSASDLLFDGLGWFNTVL